MGLNFSWGNVMSRGGIRIRDVIRYFSVFNFWQHKVSVNTISPSTARHSVRLTCYWSFNHSAFSTDLFQLVVGKSLILCKVKLCRDHLVWLTDCPKSFELLSTQLAFWNSKMTPLRRYACLPLFLLLFYLLILSDVDSMPFVTFLLLQVKRPFKSWFVLATGLRTWPIWQ